MIFPAKLPTDAKHPKLNLTSYSQEQHRTLKNR